MNNKNMMWIGVAVAFFAGLVIGFVVMRQRAIGTMEAFKLETQRQMEEAKKMSGENAMSDDEDANMMGVGYILKDGRLMLEKEETMSLVNGTITLKDGTTITVSGLVAKPDGSEVQLKEGESIWEDGTIMEAENEEEAEDSMMEKDSN